MATIICEGCGYERSRCPSNTKLCKLCAILRDAGYWSGTARTCNQTAPVRCTKVFAPLNRNDFACGECSRSSIRGRCKWCEQTGELLHRELEVCYVCAKDPAKRGVFIDALRAAQDKRREANTPQPVAA